jgi:hypothetical protein
VELKIRKGSDREHQQLIKLFGFERYVSQFYFLLDEQRPATSYLEWLEANRMAIELEGSER